MRYDTNTYSKSTSGKTTIISFDEIDNWQVDFDFSINNVGHCRWGIYPSSNGNPQLTINTENTGSMKLIYGTSCSTSDSAEASVVIGQGGYLIANHWYHATIIKQNGVATVKLDDTQIWTGDHNCTTNVRYIHMSKFNTNNVGYMKNIKIKPL